MFRMSVDPEQHPVDQYRYDSEWSDIIQYLALLYIFSKLPYYKRVGRASAFNTDTQRYRDLDVYSIEFKKFLEEVLDAKEYAGAMAELEKVHGNVRTRIYKPLPLRQVFRNLRDDLPHVHSPRIKAVLRPLIEYFKNGSEPMVAEETQAIDAMMKVRNPRLKRVIAQVKTDLPNMAAEEPEMKASVSDIKGMTRVEMATMARDTKDDTTLDNLFQVAEEMNEKTLLSALWSRGYVKGNAPWQYMNNKLVTYSNMKKLEDDVLYQYLTNMPWDWRRKFRGTSKRKTLYTKIFSQPKRQKLLKRMLEEQVDGTINLDEVNEFYRVGANYLPPSEMTPTMVKAVWKFADDPDPLVKMLDKKERVELFETDKSLSPSLWLYDLTREEVLPYLLSGQLIESAFISQHFGIGWGSMLNARMDIDDIDYVKIQTFFGSLSLDDIKLLGQVTNFKRRFVRALRSYTAREFPGGAKAWFAGIYNEASEPGKKLLLLMAPSNIVEYVRDQTGKPDEVDSIVDEMDAILQESNAKQLQGLLDMYGSYEDMDSAHWMDAVNIIPRNELWGAVQKWRGKGTWYYNWDDLEVAMVDRLPQEDLADFLMQGTKCSYNSEQRRVYLAAIAKLKPSTAPMLVGCTTGRIRRWVIENYPGDKLYDLFDSDPDWRLGELVCKFAPRMPDRDIPKVLARIDDVQSRKVEAKACLIKRLPEGTTNSYMDDDEPDIIKAAFRNSSRDAALLAIQDKRFPLIASAVERPDFIEDPEVFLEAYLKNPMWSDSWIDRAWKYDIQHIDTVAPKMDDDQFEAAARVFARLAESSTHLRGWDIWALGAYYKYTRMGSPSDLWNSIKDHFDMGDTKKDVLMKELGIDNLTWLVRNGFSESLNSVVWGWMGEAFINNVAWISNLSDKELEDLADNYSVGWENRPKYRQLLRMRKEKRRAEARGTMREQIDAAYDNKDYGEISRLLDEALKGDERRAAEDLIKQIYTKTRDETLKAQIIVHGSPELLDHLRENNVISGGMVVLYAPESYIKDRFDQLVQMYMRDLLVEHQKTPGKAARSQTKIKASLIERATPQQALELFKFYYKEQKEFGPKIRDAFLEKLEDPAFEKILVDFLLSKQYQLRIKKFTLEMLPIVLKLDNSDVTDKFNRSRQFREKASGGLVAGWEKLKTRKEKREFLDDLNDRTMMIRLLRALVEKTVSLTSPLDEEFVIGSNMPGKTRGFLNTFQQSTTTITHGELFNLSVEHASDQELHDWILTNPLQVFDYSKAKSDVTTRNLRIDWVPDNENNKVAKAFLDTWDKQVHGSFRADVTRVYKVVTPRKVKRTTKNIRTLYHGTDYFAAGCIIQGGFKIMGRTKAGRLLGNGIYFSDIGSKVSQYLHSISYGVGVTRGKGSGVVLVCEVDLGNMLDYSNMQYPVTKRNWMDHGYDSIYMERGSSYGGRKLLNNEYCVYDVNRIKILYVMDIARDRVSY